MLEIISQGDASTVQFGAIDLERRLRFGNVSADDRTYIDAIRDAVLDHLDEHVAAFFDHLAQYGEAQGLVRRADMMDEAKRLEREHMVAMVGGTHGHDYFEQRYRLGQLYNRAQLESRCSWALFTAR